MSERHITNLVLLIKYSLYHASSNVSSLDCWLKCFSLYSVLIFASVRWWTFCLSLFFFSSSTNIESSQIENFQSRLQFLYFFFVYWNHYHRSNLMNLSNVILTERFIVKLTIHFTRKKKLFFMLSIFINRSWGLAHLVNGRLRR